MRLQTNLITDENTALDLFQAFHEYRYYFEYRANHIDDEIQFTWDASDKEAEKTFYSITAPGFNSSYAL